MKPLFRDIIFSPEIIGAAWATHSFLTPTPVLIDTNTVRIFGGIRDEMGVSRIGFVDISVSAPPQIINYSLHPTLDIGEEGSFDDNGVILGDVVKVGSKLYMYYIGFQIVKKVKFLAFTGLAVSDDQGVSFSRYSSVPILDRSENENYIRTVHSVVDHGSHYEVFYSAGDKWVLIDEISYPSYYIRRFVTKNLNTLSHDLSEDVLKRSKLEYRLGRPRFLSYNDKELLLFTKGTMRRDYFPGVLVKHVGDSHWTRNDDLWCLQLRAGQFDSQHLCYPAPLLIGDNAWIFYNGNNMGRAGLALAIVSCKEFFHGLCN